MVTGRCDASHSYEWGINGRGEYMGDVIGGLP